jgi:hypothetical protein
VPQGEEKESGKKGPSYEVRSTEHTSSAKNKNQETLVSR